MKDVIISIVSHDLIKVLAVGIFDGLSKESYFNTSSQLLVFTCKGGRGGPVANA
jgi:hypothetical protein